MSDRKYEYDLTDYGDEEDYEEYARQQDKLRGYDRQRKKGSQKQAGRTSAGGRNRGGQQRLQGRNGSPAGKSRAAKAQGQKRGPDPSKKRSHPVLWFLLVLVLVLALGSFGILSSLLSGLETVRINPKVNSQAASDTIMNHYTTIAIFGVDSREQDLMAGDNRSDTMILCSIHKSTGEMKLISVYRDTWLELGDGSYGKANSAYAYGGPEQAVSMLNTNLDLDIDGFITIGFEGLADTIDSLGGIDLETGVTEEEAGYLNSYLEDMEYELGTENEPVEAGQQHLSGIQAVAFARIRYTAGSDYRRTERQREVMKAILDRLKKAGPFGLAKAARTVIGSSACSLTKTQMAGLILKAPFYKLEQSGGLPVEEYRAEDYIGEQACIIPDALADNIRWLHVSLYGQEDYQISSEADAISRHIYESYHGY